VTSEVVDHFLDLLEGVKSNGAGWSARCPCRNDDDNPSLSVAEGRQGQVLVTCHRGNGCSVNEICDALDLEMTDLWPKEESRDKPSKLVLVETYSYTDAAGELLFQKQRFVDEATGKKTFRQRKPDGRGGWEHSLGDTPKVLYNLPAVTAAVRDGVEVWVVEGEKDANSLIKEGLVATTMPGGAGKWLQIHTDALAGGLVNVVCDNDEPGRAHANAVVKALTAAGCAVLSFCPPDGFKDVTDVLARGGGLNSLVQVGGPMVQDSFSEIVVALTDLARKEKLSTSQKLIKARSLLDAAAMSAPPVSLDAVNWFDFLQDGAEDEYDWIIPGLLERTDRVIVVAAEGSGKTMLARQVAILSACGIHPFTKQKMERIRTLTIDLENPVRIIRRKSEAIMQAAMREAREKSRPEAHLVIKPDGLNLLKPQDRVAFEQMVEKAAPDLLVIGPLYKSFIDPGGRSSEAIATEIIMFLDYIRHTYNCAMWMEQHAPLGSHNARDMRPFGSAVWSRWPEFGKALVKDVTAPPNTFTVENFRGDRDERHWPSIVKWGVTWPFDVVEWQTH